MEVSVWTRWARHPRFFLPPLTAVVFAAAVKGAWLTDAASVPTATALGEGALALAAVFHVCGDQVRRWVFHSTAPLVDLRAYAIVAAIGTLLVALPLGPLFNVFILGGCAVSILVIGPDRFR